MFEKKRKKEEKKYQVVFFFVVVMFVLQMVRFLAINSNYLYNNTIICMQQYNNL